MIEAATMFSPDGHILQVEYAEKTVRLGAASIGIRTNEGVVIIADKGQKDELIIPESADKIYEIDEHIMAVAAGITSDARVLIEKARIAAQQHRITYDSPPHTEAVVKEIADMKQQFTQYGGTRPFGVALMIAGFNSKPELFTTDVTGSYLQYKANAIGETMKNKIMTMARAGVVQGLLCGHFFFLLKKSKWQDIPAKMTITGIKYSINRPAISDKK